MRELIRSAWLIAAAALIPLLLFTVFQSGFAAREEQRSIEARSLAEAESVIVASDAIIARTTGALDALATVRALAEGDVAGVRRRAGEVAALNPNWITVELVRARDGAILFDLRRPSGAATAETGAAPRGTSVGRLVRDGAGCPCVAVDRAAAGPDGGYVVRVLLAAEPFLRLLPLAGKQYEVSALVTPEGRFIARTLDQEGRFGVPGSRYLRAAVKGGKPNGIYRGATLEGFENYSAFARSGLTGWSAHIAMGTQFLDTPARRFLGSIGIAAVLSLLLAVVLIWFALRQLAAGRRAAERGQQAQKLEALGQLTGGIAHDFNNLLTPVIGALDFLLKRKSLDERGRRIANGALASAQRAGKLTAQLLAFSRRQKLEIEPVDVNFLFDELRPILEQSVGKDHVVRIDVAREALCVRTDYNQLELAILNLVINARDAMPEGGTIRVEAASARDTVTIRVIDEGEGMSAETRQRALEPFFTTKSTGRGTGLGLAQVFGVMQQSEGTIDIDSRVGSGTTVTLRLPVCDEIPARRQRLSSGAAATAAIPLRLLLVDDDAAVRAALSRLFEDDGHIVDSVGDARIALTAIEHIDYDLAIVDFAMPVMDGAGLISAARKLRPNQKFLMITGYSDSEAVTAACPDTPVIRKPFDSEALRERVLELAA